MKDNPAKAISDDKRKFAEALLRDPNNPYKVAFECFPDQPGMVSWVSTQWPKDREVIEWQELLLEEEGEAAFLPSHSDLAREIWDKMQSDGITPDEFGKLAKLYAEIMGHVKKPQSVINNSNQQNENKVMVIVDNGSDDDWETKLEKQQKSLRS